MSNLKKLKTHDRQVIVQNLTTAMKKRYKSAVPKHALPLLETLLLAAVVENVTYDDGEEAYERLIKSFHDLNEIRVSSISEIEGVLHPVGDAAWKALRIRDVLQQVFEKFYRFDLEEFKRKPADQIEKLMAKWKFTTPFMKHYLYQHALGSHSIALDDKSRDALAFLGVVEPGATIDEASEDLKHIVRKADSSLFCHLVRCLSCDPQFKGKLKLTAGQSLGEGPDPTTAVQRLNEVLSGHTPKAPPSVKIKPEPVKPAPAKAAPEPVKAPEVSKPVAPMKMTGKTAFPAKTAPVKEVAKAAPVKAAPAKAAPVKAAPAMPTSAAHTTTVKKPVDKKTPVRSGQAAEKSVTKKVSKPAPAKKPARKK